MKTKEIRAMTEKCEDTSRVLKSLAHPQRLLILCLLAEGERTVGDLGKLCHTSQSQLSQFLQRMKSEELVGARREGKFVFYYISDRKVLKMIKALHKIFCT